METDLTTLLARRAPRYTSYPTAVQFTPEVGEAQARSWLAALPAMLPVGARCRCTCTCRSARRSAGTAPAP